MAARPPTEEEMPPASVLTPEAVKATDQARGAIVHTFDPSDSPAEKEREAASAKAKLAPIARLKKQSATGGAREVSIDTGVGAPTPTVTLSPAGEPIKTTVLNGTSIASGDIPTEAEESPKGEPVGAQGVPGAIPAQPTEGLPDWYKIGWRQVSGIDAMPTAGEAAERSLLEAWVSQQSYGTMYHNAGVIFFAVLASRLLTLFRLGWASTIILLAFCATYYDTSIRRVRQSARDDIQRELVKTRLVTESESADWINSFLHRFWRIYEPVLSATIVASVENVLSTSTPSFLESIKMTQFTLGNKAPRIDSVRTFPKTADDIVIMDWGLSFTTNDISDITPNELKFKTNPKIVLEIKVGKGFISAPFPILLEDISFIGKMRIKLKLMNPFPHVQLVEMSFLEKPIFDYVLKPIGGETLGFDIGSIPGLSPFIRDQVHGILGPMMYDPNVFTLNLEQLLSGQPLDASIGVLQLKVVSGKGLKSSKLGGGQPDPFVSIAIAGKTEIARTKTKMATANPHWNEDHFVLINNLNDILALSVWDWNEHRTNSEIGIANFELAKLKEDAEQQGLTANILREGKERGEIRFDATFHPILKAEKNVDGKLEPIPEVKTGIVRLVIHQAKDLSSAGGLGGGLVGGAVNPYAKLFVGGSKEAIHTTGIFKNNFAPSWESPKEFLVLDKSRSVITVQVIDDRDFAKDPSLGRVSVSLKDLLTAQERQQDWFQLSGVRTGRIRLSAEWKPLALPGGINGGAAYVPPIGILRVHLKKAIDVKNVEGALGGKSDPYVRVVSGGNILGRTEVCNNNLNPDWDQIVYIPVHSTTEHAILEVMDYQNLTKDRSLGTVEIQMAAFCQQTDDVRTPFHSTGLKSLREKIQLAKGSYKGELYFDVEFCPAVNLKGGVNFDTQEDTISSAVGASSGSNSSSSAASTAAVPAAARTAPADSTASHASLESTSIIGTADANAGVNADVNADGTPNESKQSGVVISREELLRTQSGVLVCQLVSGQLQSKGRLEVLIDEGYWPAFSSERARSHRVTWDQVGEAFVKELDFGRIVLRINENDESDKEDVVAQVAMDTKMFLDQCLDAPSDFKLLATDGSGRISTVKICAKFVPVDINLLPRELFTDHGTLVLELVDGEGLKGADRSGKSDPYAVFELNGAKVFKSDTKKKTLTPVWNERFQVEIPSRAAGNFTVEVYDWDRVGSAESLGAGIIDLTQIEPFEQTEMRIALVSAKHGQQGSIRVRMTFQPAIIVKARKNTSTFSTAGRAVTQVGGVPLGVGKAVGKGAIHGVVGVGHGLGSVGGFAGRKIGLVKRKDKSGKEILVEEVLPEESSLSGVDTGAGVAAGGVGVAGLPEAAAEGGYVVPGVTSTDFVNRGTPLDGHLSVSVISASGLAEEVKAVVEIRIGMHSRKSPHSKHKSSTPEWDEGQITFPTGPDTLTATVVLWEHKALGKDKLLGIADVPIWNHISAATPDADVQVSLTEGQGSVRLRLSWRGTPLTPRQSSQNGHALTVSTSAGAVPASPSSVGRAQSIRSPSKFFSRKSKDAPDLS